MAANIVTLKNADKTAALLPRTRIKAIADDQGRYLDSGLTAPDIDVLKGGAFDQLKEKAQTNQANIADLAERVEELEDQGTFRYKGNCAFADLPTSGQQVGDEWYVTDKYCMYAWDGTSWNPIGDLGISWQLDDDGDYCLFIDDGE